MVVESFGFWKILGLVGTGIVTTSVAVTSIYKSMGVVKSFDDHVKKTDVFKVEVKEITKGQDEQITVIKSDVAEYKDLLIKSNADLDGQFKGHRVQNRIDFAGRAEVTQQFEAITGTLTRYEQDRDKIFKLVMDEFSKSNERSEKRFDKLEDAVTLGRDQTIANLIRKIEILESAAK